tara:strand:+ start:813 stop:1514 length:702 start_codon:yes stop_codon:yes gene_type:complete
MDQIVFFWTGKNLFIPEYFVKSIIKNFCKKYKIIQVSDTKTNKIDGVDVYIKADLPADIMTARLKAYSLVETKNKNTIFCDADSLMISELYFDDFVEGYHLMKRKRNSLINHLHPEYFPEFKNKYFMDLMPFLFGAIIISKKENFFVHLYNICTNLPARFHRWYGDQISLHIFYLDNKSKFLFFDQDKYMHIIDKKNNNPKEDLQILLEKKIHFITFKGPKSKKQIIDYFSLL